MLTHCFPSTLVDRLYSVGERLECDWRNVSLPYDLTSYCVYATLACLDRYKAPARLTSGELERDALRLFRCIWNRNARKLSARWKRACQNGKMPTVCSYDDPQHSFLLESVPDDRNTLDLSANLSLLQEIRLYLLEKGYSREVVQVYLWRNAFGYEWDEVQKLLSDHFEVEMSVPALRQWGSRKFPALSACLRQGFPFYEYSGFVT